MRWLDPVRRALDEAPVPVPFFFRDDDVGWGDQRLWPLLHCFESYDLPVDLAVIPAELTPTVASAISKLSGRIGLHQHGLAHLNHEPSGRKYEFGESRPREVQRHDIAEGRVRLNALVPDADPIFTPPWNRCTIDTAQCLVELGFSLLSREWKATPFEIEELPELPVRVDWFAHDHGVRLTPDAFGAYVADAVGTAERPVGVMFHHAVMDDDEIERARGILALVASHPMAEAMPMREAATNPPA